ncbi:MAG: GIY-YIG nuclease family protein [Tenuifilaceae bacterium]
MYFTYILYSESLGKFYSGQTEDLDRRIDEHNRGKTTFAAKGMPWRLVYYKQFASRKEAVHCEIKVKKRGAGRFLADAGITVG